MAGRRKPRTRSYGLTVGAVELAVTHRRTGRVTFRAKANGTVTVSAPRSWSKTQVEAIVRDHLPQIRRLREKAQGPEEVRGLRKAYGRLAPGDVVRVWGRPRTVVVEEGPEPTVELSDDILRFRGMTDGDERRAAFQGLLRRELLEKLPDVRRRAEERCGVAATHWTVRPMVSRWGSCRYETGRITLNLDLACHDPAFLELVVVHELCHLIGHDHGIVWQAAIDRALPRWRELQGRLDDEGIWLPKG